MTYSLNGTWTLKREKTNDLYEVSVPSDTYTQLLEAKVIPDPFYSTNEKDVQWVGSEDFTYTRTFTLSEADLNKRKLLLSCKALDTLCKLYVNDTLVGEGKNAFLQYNFDIKSAARVGENTVTVKFLAPVPYAENLQKEKPLPKNNNGTDGIAYLRKPACHFGWDWGPSLPLSGITDSIEILSFDNRLEDLELRQIHENGKVRLQIKPLVDGEGEVRGKVICPDGAELPFAGESEILIENPELWWTKELSGKETQPLYTVTASLEDSSVTKEIGLRTIRLDRKEDKFGGNFCFYLNDVPIFAKGASWILPDSLMGRVTKDTYDYYIDSALAANFNMLRIWGGAYYGTDYFYEQCDKKGLLVWQDFMFACLMYPFYEDDFRENVMKEVHYQVARLKHHASLCLWAGNNEIETMFSYMPEKLKIVQWYKKFFYEILKNEMAVLDPDTPYIETSPIGKSFRKGVTGDSYGDTHMWNVWHGQKPLNYYRKRMTRFCSEFGLESLPSADAVRTFAEEKDMGLTTEVFNAHQKCPCGNRKMLFYLLEKFYEAEHFKDMIYMTGLIQKECIADATEHWRRNRGRCNGSLFWQYNDCWQAPSWSSVDYLGKWKPLQYHARHFFEPLSVSVCESKKDYKIFCINDLKEEKKVSVLYKLQTLDGKVILEKKVEKALAPCNSICVAEEAVSGDLTNLVLSVKMLENERIVSERTKIFVPDKDLKLQKATVQKEVTKTADGLTIRLLSPVFCRSVMVDIENEREPFSDNYFDLLPGEEKVITLKTQKPYSAEAVTIKSLADIPVKADKRKAKLFRFKFALEPLNIGNWIWYSVN